MSIDRRNFLRIAAGAVGALGIGAGATGNAGAGQASAVTPGKESPIGKLKPMIQGIVPISEFHPDSALDTLTKAEMEACFPRLRSFLEKSLDKKYRDALEETLPGWKAVVGPQEAADIESFVKARLR